MPDSSTPPWRYGVYAFVVSPLLTLVVYATAYVALVTLESPSVGVEPNGVALVGLIVAHLLLAALSYLFAAVVVVSLFMDARALGDESGWTPNRLLAVTLGFVHFAGALLTIPYLVSVPAISYYLYRRRRHVAGLSA